MSDSDKKEIDEGAEDRHGVIAEELGPRGKAYAEEILPILKDLHDRCSKHDIPCAFLFALEGFPGTGDPAVAFSCYFGERDESDESGVVSNVDRARPIEEAHRVFAQGWRAVPPEIAIQGLLANSAKKVIVLTEDDDSHDSESPEAARAVAEALAGKGIKVH